MGVASASAALDAAVRILRNVGVGFTSLRGSPREARFCAVTPSPFVTCSPRCLSRTQLWLAYAMKGLESFGYFSLSSILTARDAVPPHTQAPRVTPRSHTLAPPQLFLTEEFGMTDVSAGAAYGLYGTLSTLYGLLLGSAVDALGVRRTLAASFLVSALAKVVIATTRSKAAVLAMLYGPLPAAGALGIPVMTIAIRRCTHTGNRGFAFGMFYTLMNVAALVSGVFVDAFRLGFKHGFNVPSRGPHSALNSGQRLLVLLGAATSLVGAGVALRMREGVRVGDEPPAEGPPARFSGEVELGMDEMRRAASEAEAGAPPELMTYRQLLREPRLWKYMAMCVLMVNLKSIFRHVDATLPKFLIRAFGCNAPVGSIYSINPAIIIFLVPMVSAGTTRVRPFDMIRHGGWLSALSPLWLTLKQSYGGAVAFVVMLSLGEAAWSPRWYDYTMSVAPEGREGAFTALAAAPLFLATLPTGLMSGELLNRFCPASAEAACSPGGKPDPGAFCHGRPMWGIIAGVTLASPVMIAICAPWLRPSEDARGAESAPAEANVSDAASEAGSSVFGGAGPDAHSRRGGRLEALADALTGGFGGLRDGLRRAVSRSVSAARPTSTLDEGLLAGDEDADEWEAPDGGGLHSPLLLRPRVYADDAAREQN